jgi:hypothetical protein
MLLFDDISYSHQPVLVEDDNLLAVKLDDTISGKLFQASL